MSSEKLLIDDSGELQFSTNAYMRKLKNNSCQLLHLVKESLTAIGGMSITPDDDEELGWTIPDIVIQMELVISYLETLSITEVEGLLIIESIMRIKDACLHLIRLPDINQDEKVLLAKTTLDIMCGFLP